ncbi:unnamed protein product [Nyctereutes procyonoides]|uniref:(raccoon dog) hypothetical protein n=1 Tax=Nyctereutes procyonoides TaxID=34880 RepID=A0A811Y233_NYCPR|nr:unnamed protein product [Nyctereutes procyonoides]
MGHVDPRFKFLKFGYYLDSEEDLAQLTSEGVSCAGVRRTDPGTSSRNQSEPPTPVPRVVLRAGVVGLCVLGVGTRSGGSGAPGMGARQGRTPGSRSAPGGVGGAAQAPTGMLQPRPVAWLPRFPHSVASTGPHGIAATSVQRPPCLIRLTAETQNLRSFASMDSSLNNCMASGKGRNTLNS